MLACQHEEYTARLRFIMDNTNLSKQQQDCEIMRQMLTQAQTESQRYGSSHIVDTAKDISNVVTDAASGVVDIFHGIDKAVADTWNNFWKDGKADGIGS